MWYCPKKSSRKFQPRGSYSASNNGELWESSNQGAGCITKSINRSRTSCSLGGRLEPTPRRGFLLRVLSPRQITSEMIMMLNFNCSTARYADQKVGKLLHMSLTWRVELNQCLGSIAIDSCGKICQQSQGQKDGSFGEAFIKQKRFRAYSFLVPNQWLLMVIIREGQIPKQCIIHKKVECLGVLWTKRWYYGFLEKRLCFCIIVRVKFCIFKIISLYFSRMRKHSIPNFIKKAWDMLEQEENWTVISWNQEGTSFVIQDESRFAQALLPRYFKHSKIASFIRQLNMYNFHKRKTESGRTQFFHKLFRKNHRELLIGIKRKPSQAEINEAEELIKELAPECLQATLHQNQENYQDGGKGGAQVEQTHQSHFIPDFHLCYYPDPSQYMILTPIMLTNLYPDYQWKQEKMVTNNIIIQGIPPEYSENVNYPLTF